ncbi:MAG: hypothetical protein AB7O66_18445 [Limisphaerales bacterium]
MNRTEPLERPRDPVVGGLLLRPSRDPRLRASALATVAGHPSMTLGDPVGDWWPLALEAENASDGRDLHAWLTTVPGVDWVEVVSVGFEGMDETNRIQAPESDPDALARVEARS